MTKKIPDYKYGDTFKFKSLNIFSSSEWMADSKRKYRKVFDKNEINYLRWEFSFFNKLFDEEEWECKTSIKTFNITSGKREEICSLTCDNLKIRKEENIIFVNESWGVDKLGGFWKKGDYITEAYIDDKLVGSQVFYIHEVGEVTTTYNPYFDVVSLKAFEGPKVAPGIKERKFLKVFKKDAARYIWFELQIKNKQSKAWWFEYFVNIYDDAGQPKAHMENLKSITVNSKDKIFTFDKGWGTDEGGSWKDIKYYVDIVFMDTLVASLAFEAGDQDVEGETQMTANAKANAIQQQLKETEPTEESLNDVIKKLDELIGLSDIKNKIKEHISYLEFIKLRKEKGFEDSENLSLHSVFTGNPGTGKTTVVKLLGKIYQKMGLLSKGHVHEVDRADLVGEFIGQTAPRVKDAIKEARGGILFIDEAYSLYRAKDDAKDFGKEVIEILIKEMSDGEGDIAIMVAGYPKEMDTFINSNPGLKSRFKYYFHFDDYFPEELVAITEYASVKRSVELTEEAKLLVEKMITEAYRNRDKTFGNARFAYSIIDEGKMNMGLRLMQRQDVKQLTKAEMSTVIDEDIKKIIATKYKKKVDINIDEHLLRETLKELNALVGLENIKTEINELVKLVRYYRETGKDVLNKFSLHTVFTGNPGTGKTTVARLIGKIYKALGLLEKGHIVETGRDGLVAGYIGQTAIKTKEKMDEAMGGVLFIDEAYGLADGGQSGYGKEAIEIILKNMEDNRGRMAVIVAGYPDNMDVFLKSNPGLMSRFDRTLHFKDYSTETLFNIALYLFSLENLKFSIEAEKHLQNYLLDIYNARDKYFGNAREVRKIVEQTVKKQNIRMASLTNDQRTPEMMETIGLEDVAHFIYEKPKGGSIGFGKK
jgi:SpoVK/Ycf46/Vps4 family AAA+-type ATPase